MLFYLFILNKCWIQALSGHYIVCLFVVVFLFVVFKPGSG